MTMTRDTFEASLRRVSQVSHKVDLLRSPPTGRRPSKVNTFVAKRSLMRDDFLGSDRTLVTSSLDSNSSSRSNVHTLASSSYYTDSNADVESIVKADNEDMDDEEDEEREKVEEVETDKGLWDKHVHYLLFLFGAVFGINNVLSFPALALEHGGGAFLFTYVLLSLVVGLPIMYLEVSLGQYARGGLVKSWRILPIARGIAVTSLLITLCRSTYSSTPVIWSLYYVYCAATGSMPVSSYSPADIDVSTDSTNQSQEKNLTTLQHRQLYNASNLFFYSSTLEASDSISHTGHVLPHMSACLLLIWAVVFSLSLLGPRLTGKISFCFTALPSILLLITLVAVCTMPGSVLGIQSFLNPRWHHLAAVKPWLDVLDFVLSSLSCGTGVVITLSGHCQFHGDTFRSAITLTSLSIVMTTVCGCLMFSMIGAESRMSGLHVHQDNMTRLSDVELGFVLFPSVVSRLPAPSVWLCGFYLILILLGVIQAVLAVHTCQQAVLDIAHLVNISRHWKTGILGAVVVVMMLLNILTVSENGLHVLRLLQLSVTWLSTPLVCAAQCVTLGWGYGARRFAGRVSEMTGRSRSFLWRWLWRWGCPILLAFAIIASVLTTNLLQDLPTKDKNKKWLHGVAWSISPIIVFPGLTMALVAFFSVPGTFRQRIKQLRSTPTTWGPGHPEHEPQADLPDYVICHPDPFRPANALAMLTANLYLPNIVNFVSMQPRGPASDMAPGYISEVATLTSSEDETSMGSPASKDNFFGRCSATVTSLSHVVGLGNVVRFPYLAYRHGGGAFLVAYLTVLLVCGIPLVVIETAIGQFSNLGPVNVWRAVPIFKGVGYSMVLVSVVSSVYYSVITSWSMFYLATSLTSVMPWQNCGNSWNTNSCQPLDLTFKLCHIYNKTVTDNMTGLSILCWTSSDPSCVPENMSETSRCSDMSDLTSFQAHSGSHGNSSFSPSDEYFYLAVLKMSKSWSEVGEIRWQLVLCLFLTWAMVTLFLFKCYRPGRKVTYVILVLTCTVLVILLIRTSSQVGGHDGLSMLFTPQWPRLISSQVWRDAISQVFFSLSLGSGTLVVMGTYNKFNKDLFREAILLCVIDAAVSLLSSLVIFAVIGVLAHAAGVAIEMAARADLGLAFVALSSAALQLPWPIFWAILVFLMLVLLGVFTCVAGMATAVTSVIDVFSPTLKKQRAWLMLSLCAGSALLGLPMSVQVGFYLIDLLDTHLSGLPQACVGGVAGIAFAWVYGLNRFCQDIKRMNNSTVGFGWKILWLIVCPCVTAILLVISLVSLTVNNSDISHPVWATVVGFMLCLFLIAPIFAGSVHEVSHHKSLGLLERLRKSCQPRKEWGATLNRCSSIVEYYPTVHTHMGLDISREGLNTVADHVEFSPVGVKVPSLSQTTLLPLSPSSKKMKKPLDMRHKAILNHAYSNPQCDISSVGSLDKMASQKGYPVFLTQGKYHDIIIVKRSDREVITCDASTQTDHSWTENKLCRQRSQPTVHVSKPFPLIARSSSWHQLKGQPAILEVTVRELDTGQDGQTQEQQAVLVEVPRRRRHGQSMPPNLCLLISQNEPQIHMDSSAPEQTKPDPSSCQIRLLDLHQIYQSDFTLGVQENISSVSDNSEASHVLPGMTDQCNCCNVEPEPVSSACDMGPVSSSLSHSQPNIYTRRRSRLQDHGSRSRGSRSKSADETPISLKRPYDRYGPSQELDNHISSRTGPEHGSSGMIKRLGCGSQRERRLSCRENSRSIIRRGANVIMEEADLESEEDKYDIDSRLQFLQAEAEISKM